MSHPGFWVCFECLGKVRESTAFGASKPHLSRDTVTHPFPLDETEHATSLSLAFSGPERGFRPLLETVHRKGSQLRPCEW